MRSSIIGLSALALVAVATPAFAEEAASDFTITGSTTLTSDYRFRGVSQTAKKIAIQGSATLAHSSGFYTGFWASSVDDYIYSGTTTSQAELDLIAGYSTTIGGITLDGGLLYYVYPSVNGIDSDFFEPYASAKYTYGPVTAKVGVAYAPKQSALANVPGVPPKEDNLYLYTDLSTTLPVVPVTLSGHLGYSKGASYLTFGLSEYLDWNITASYTYKNVTFGVSYVDTDVEKGVWTGGGKDIAEAGVVGSISFAF